MLSIEHDIIISLSYGEAIKVHADTEWGGGGNVTEAVQSVS